MKSLALPAAEQVPSWSVSEEQLASWGFPVEKREKCAGVWEIVRLGVARHKAVHAAWCAGWVRIASAPESERAARLAKSAPSVCPEAMAWAMECKAKAL